ncbi:LOW QUALITY PROTEIN: hypothetical protein MXB_5543 [Myxobolus squamalis]|nr:LOW QUALITY PROTEIN: hypothetical protein MXB_5543 [Myxobolus squamalis]
MRSKIQCLISMIMDDETHTNIPIVYSLVENKFECTDWKFVNMNLSIRQSESGICSHIILKTLGSIDSNSACKIYPRIFKEIKMLKLGQIMH